MKYLISILILMITINTTAQFKNKSYFSPGIIISSKDTIVCFIENYINYNSETINYKINKDDNKTLKIESLKINQLRINRNEYDRVIVEKKSYLMKKIKKGAITLYYYYYTKTTSSSFQQNGFNNQPGTAYHSSVEAKSLYFVGKGKTIQLTKKKFKEDLKFLMSENLDFQSKIDELKYKDRLFEYDLKNLISKYNYWHKYK